MKMDQFFQHYDLLREVVGGMLDYKWKRVEVLLLMVRMNVYGQATGKGAPFASANWYAGNSLCSEKTVDRLVGWLKKQKFAKVRRLRRRDTEATWIAHNSRGEDNQGWHQLAAQYGPGGPFKVYPEGFYSTNEIDLQPLLTVLRKLLGRALNRMVKGFRVYRDQGGITFKAWFPIDPSFNKSPPVVEGFLSLA